MVQDSKTTNFPKFSKRFLTLTLYLFSKFQSVPKRLCRLSTSKLLSRAPQKSKRKSTWTCWWLDMTLGNKTKRTSSRKTIWTAVWVHSKNKNSGKSSLKAWALSLLTWTDLLYSKKCKTGSKTRNLKFKHRHDTAKVLKNCTRRQSQHRNSNIPRNSNHTH
jgi:hypothetical protein